MGHWWEKVQTLISKILGDETAGKLVTYFVYCWSGQEALWKVFWLYLVLGTFLISSFLVAPLAVTGGRLAESLALLVVLPYFAWAIKATWACAENIETDNFKGVDKVYLTLASKVVAGFVALNYFLALFA
ncbi:MAG: hypothetical protein VXY83_01925 [Pseudomonadota bacterium]|jgi:hypothetical protein|nr:hypothetical protein [Magnetococcales bacterium]MEC8067100.1 hypothetical protein [Pseudomonadota bacterium]MEC8467089.1 hypothetical protein [Pseudomonadota bacterium]|tara:strand:+ start:12416 stop:12805 length:390 start_codon:yes stop_codon:yes gene_type:complete